MTPNELFAQFCRDKGRTPFLLLDHMQAAIKPFADKGLTADAKATLTDADWLVGCHLANVAMEAESEAKAQSRGMGFANTEGIYRGQPNLAVECLARLGRELPLAQWIYARIFQLGRENRHAEAAQILFSYTVASSDTAIAAAEKRGAERAKALALKAWEGL